MSSLSQDGTLTDSIAAVEAAWGKVANDLGLDPAYVIAATHGKRGIDNLAHFKPHIKAHEMDAEVEKFERMILDFADAYNKNRLGFKQDGNGGKTVFSGDTTGYSTPEMASDNSSNTSSRSSFSLASSPNHRPSFATHLSHRLADASQECALDEDSITMADTAEEVAFMDIDKAQTDAEEAWKIEAAAVDRSVHILPGVRKMLDSLPDGRYAVATSGAKTYGMHFPMIILYDGMLMLLS